jgi:hypothetical protein
MKNSLTPINKLAVLKSAKRYFRGKDLKYSNSIELLHFLELKHKLFFTEIEIDRVFEINNNIPMNKAIQSLINKHLYINPYLITTLNAAYNALLYDVDVEYGAPMGRPSILSNKIPECRRIVRVDDGYDKGGAYWGIGEPLYVEFNKDLSYINFTRE